MTAAKHVVIVRSTPIAPEPRAQRTAVWLSQSGWQVRILGWDRLADLPRDEKQERYTIVRLPIQAGFGLGFRMLWPLVRWQFGLLLWLYRHRTTYGVVHAADFDTILPAFFIAKVCRKRLVYDIYDFYSDSHIIPTFLARIVRGIERWLISRADAVILVDESRGEQIKGTTPKRLAVIYNTTESLTLPQVTRLPGRLQIAYVGILTLGRSLLELFEVLQHHSEWKLDLAGYGRDKALILDRSQHLPNVCFFGRIPYERAQILLAQSDLMFAIYDPAIPNHRFASANKLFEAMMLGKPIIVARDTGMDRIVQEHKLGFVVSYGDLAALENALATVAAWDIEARARFARHARQVFDANYSSVLMGEKLARLYQSLYAS